MVNRLWNVMDLVGKNMTIKLLIYITNNAINKKEYSIKLIIYRSRKVWLELEINQQKYMVAWIKI